MDRQPGLLTLPQELLQLILRATLPPLSFDSFAARSSILLPLLTLNKVLGALALLEIFRHVGLKDPHAVARFAESLQAYPRARSRPGDKTISIHLGSRGGLVSGYENAMSMFECLPYTPNVREIWLVGIRPMSLLGLSLAPGQSAPRIAVPTLTRFPPLPEIRTLHVRNIYIMEPLPLPLPLSPSPHLLPHLQHLTLHSSTLTLVDIPSFSISSTPLPLLLPLLFPPLLSLSIFDSHVLSPDLSSTALDFSPVAAGSCETLTIDTRRAPPHNGRSSGTLFVGDFTRDWVAELPRYTALTRLAVTGTENLGALAEALDSGVRLETLRIVRFEGCEEEVGAGDGDERVVEVLGKGLAALAGLRRLIVPREVGQEDRSGGRGDEMEVDGSGSGAVTAGEGRVGRERLRKVCEAAGVELAENELAGDGSGDVAEWKDWETADLFW